MKKASNGVRAVSHPASPGLSKSAARNIAAQSTREINERSRIAVEQAKIAVEDARFVIANSKSLAAELKVWRRSKSHQARLDR